MVNSCSWMPVMEKMRTIRRSVAAASQSPPRQITCTHQPIQHMVSCSSLHPDTSPVHTSTNTTHGQLQPVSTQTHHLYTPTNTTHGQLQQSQPRQITCMCQPIQHFKMGYMQPCLFCMVTICTLQPAPDSTCKLFYLFPHCITRVERHSGRIMVLKMVLWDRLLNVFFGLCSSLRET